MEQAQVYFKILNKNKELLMIDHNSWELAKCKCAALGESWGCIPVEITKSEYDELREILFNRNAAFLGV